MVRWQQQQQDQQHAGVFVRCLVVAAAGYLVLQQAVDVAAGCNATRSVVVGKAPDRSLFLGRSAGCGSIDGMVGVELWGGRWCFVCCSHLLFDCQAEPCVCLGLDCVMGRQPACLQLLWCRVLGWLVLW